MATKVENIIAITRQACIYQWSCCSDMDSGNPLQLGQWTHLVIILMAEDIIYVNGVKANEKTQVKSDATEYL
jgi:hypothetical protein